MRTAAETLTIIEIVRVSVRGFKYWSESEQAARDVDPFHALIGVVLSHRTVGTNAWKASQRLFSVYPTPQKIADAPIGAIEELIRPAGLKASKGPAIKKIANIVHYELNDQIPTTEEGLLKLPRIGRKSMNAMMSFIYHIPAVVVDTHVQRISWRTEISDSKSAWDTEDTLKKLVPREDWSQINMLFVAFGRTVCKGHLPKCSECRVRRENLCNWTLEREEERIKGAQ